MKKKYISSLVIGEEIQNEQFAIQTMCGKDSTYASLLLCDNSGTITAMIPLTSLNKLGKCDENTVLTISGKVVCGENRKPFIQITECAVSDDFIPTELFCGLSRTKIKSYIEDIEALKTMVRHPGYSGLLDATLTSENLEKLGALPATLNLYGQYSGGALAATDAVTRMVTSTMASYSKRGNGITTCEPDWDVLVTASLLFRYGCIRFFTSSLPFKKTAIGISVGYFSCLQSMIEDALRRNNVNLSEFELAFLLNILQVSVSDKTEIKAVSKEGAVLRSMVRLYSECDNIDRISVTHESESKSESKDPQDYFYSTKLGGYVLPKSTKQKCASHNLAGVAPSM